MKAFLLSTLLSAIGYSQYQQPCTYSTNDGLYTLNLTQISRWSLELQTPQHFYYYTPCRNGITCIQGNANFHVNTAQFKQGANQCEHYLSVDHHEQASYSFIGGTWRFRYEDGQLCDITQQPRATSIYFHCNNVNTESPANVEAVVEYEPCNYYYSIESTLACMPQNNHNANCQWRTPDGNGNYYYLDLSDIQGTTVHASLGTNGYEIYTSICSNNLHCYQQHQQQVMSVIDNRATGTCEHSLAVWEQGQVQPLMHQNGDELHWTFHYWNGQTCSNGQQGEEKIRFFCDEQQEEPKVMGVYTEGNCIFDMNISTKAACLPTEPRWVDAKKWINKL
eukprot:535536_1